MTSSKSSINPFSFTLCQRRRPSMFCLTLCFHSLFHASLADPLIEEALSAECSSSSEGLDVYACAALQADSLDEGTGLHLLQRNAILLQRAGALSRNGSVVTKMLSFVDPRGSYHHQGYTITPPKECSMTSSNVPMSRVAIIIPCVMIVFFGILSYASQKVWRPPPVAQRSSNMPKVTHVDKDGLPVHINWHFVPWSSTAIAMANVNYVVVLPAAVENFGGSFTEAGVWVGLYAFGSLFALPYFVSLGHYWSRTALASHAIFTLVGNAIMVLAAYAQSLGWLYFGRFVTGLAGSYKYSCDHGCLHLIPTWDRLEAIFITRMAYAVGFALGPCISPICDWVLLQFPVLLDIFPTYNAAAEAVPLVVMTVYGIIFLFMSLFLLTAFEILDPEAEGVSDISIQAINLHNVPWERKMRAIKIFTSTNVTNFTRIFIRVAWEAGALVTLVRQYCLSTIAGVVISLTAISLVVSRNAMSKLTFAVGGDNAKLMRVFEWTGIVSCPFLFRVGVPTEFSLSLFLIGSIVFYNSNSAQSGVLLALGAEAAIPGHRWLNKKALNIYYFLSNIVAYIFGPITSFVTQQLQTGQNTVAGLVVAVTLIQVVITYVTVRPRSEYDAKSPLSTPGKGK